MAVGTEAERKAALRQRVSVYIINRENVQWLIDESGIPFDYDMVVIDELSSFKSYQAKRFRTLLKVRPGIKRIVGLTGTPSSNGLMDLWAEFRILDIPVSAFCRKLSQDCRFIYTNTRTAAARLWLTTIRCIGYSTMSRTRR